MHRINRAIERLLTLVHLRPSVAVIVPLMDRAADLRLSLPRMRLQDYPRYTVYLVDNASRDHLTTVLLECETMVHSDPFRPPAPLQLRRQPRAAPLVVIRRPRPAVFSFAVSRNCGVRCSASDLLLFVNGDSVFDTSQTLRGIVEAFLRSPDLAPDWFARWRVSCGYPPVHGAATNERINSRWRRVFVHGSGSLLLVERYVFQQLGGYNELLHDWGYEDTDLVARLQLAGFSRIELRGVHDATQDDAEALRVRHFQVKDRHFTWMRNRLISDYVIAHSGVVCRASRVPGHSAAIFMNGRWTASAALPQHAWVIEPPLSPAVREAVQRLFDTYKDQPALVYSPPPTARRQPTALLPPCSTLWIGSRLGPLERACLRSILRHGHALTLYCYEEVAGVPEGVQLADAATIVPRERIIRHAGGSYALFSNHFRYQLLARLVCGLWVDTDLYCVAPMALTDPYVLGWQDTEYLNGAVLRLPPDAAVLPPLLAIFEAKTPPPWLPPEARAAALEQLQQTGRIDLGKAPWGVAGPSALTYLIKAHGLAWVAQPQPVFYPVHWRQAEWILDPSLDLSMMVSNATLAVHLWNERIKHVKDTPAPQGSFLARLQEEGS